MEEKNHIRRLQEFLKNGINADVIASQNQRIEVETKGA